MRADPVARFHVGSWLLWLAAAMLAALSTRNPIYLAVVAGIGWTVGAWLERGERLPVLGSGSMDVTSIAPVDPARGGRGLLLRAVVGLTVAVALLKGISLHL